MLSCGADNVLAEIHNSLSPTGGSFLRAAKTAPHARLRGPQINGVLVKSQRIKTN
jgi:hypothetical protein